MPGKERPRLQDVKLALLEPEVDPSPVQPGTSVTLYSWHIGNTSPQYIPQSYIYIPRLLALWRLCGREARECGQPVGNTDVVHRLPTRPEGLGPVRRTRPQIHSALFLTDRVPGHHFNE